MNCTETLIAGGASASIAFGIAYLLRALYKEWTRPSVVEDVEKWKAKVRKDHLTGKSSWGL